MNAKDSSRPAGRRKEFSHTTLGLARYIATAVLRSVHLGAFARRHPRASQDIPTQAVLQALRDTGTWFCRVEEQPLRTTLVPLEQPASPGTLARRIRAWREDDRAGYDTAIALLCEAEAVLDHVASSSKRRRTP